ncbi:MAG TPA: response regulator [Termitinemataceae bacterium]|nr:response regulator [Treponemataceae bacterium]HOJ98907.1 response regulator [Termitinemataceae bacterium]HPQ01141.1 response regulator [Termitinemataceae bacterium]
MKRLLIVDDEPLIRLFIRNLEDWQSNGMKFAYEASNGQEALEILETHNDIDAIIADVDMPVMDGLALAETLYNRGSKIPILFLSAFDTFDFARRAFKAGAFDYILKSEMDEGRLKSVLNQLFSNTSSEPTGITETNRGQQERQELFRSLVSGIITVFDEKSPLEKVGLSLPVTLFVIRPIDIQLIKDRYKDDVGAFERIVLDLTRQALAKVTQGEVFSLSFERYLVLSSITEKKDQFIEYFTRSAYQYLDMEFEIQQSDPLENWYSLREAYLKIEERMSSFSKLVVRARRYIREHYRNPSLNLQEIAQYVGVSKNHLSWEYGRETGESLSSYIAKIRIEAAKQLLATTDLKIYEIAEQTGFENVETFCRVFKRITGTNPRKFGQ